MQTNHKKDAVRAQYERWPYPAPIADLSTIDFNSPFGHVKDLSEFYWALWPSGSQKRLDLDILVAGCGTNLAASYAYHYRDARVIGIDISSQSLAHEQYLKQKHQLNNLELHEMALEGVAALDRTFDFISVAGVLHHLASPVAGLKILGDVLRRDGVASVMIYGTHGRYGLYMLQDLFRLMSLVPSDRALALVKQTLAVLPPDHPIRPYLQTPDLKTDAGLVDSFLHPRDVSYTVPQCLDLVREAGMAFAGWNEPILYWPEAQLPAGTQLRTDIENLPEQNQWAAMELFHGRLPMHAFFAVRADRDPTTYRVDLSSPGGLLQYVPVRRDRLVVQRHVETGTVSLELKPFRSLALNQPASLVFQAIDDHRTLAQCVAATPGVSMETGVDLVARLARIGYLLLRTPAAGSTSLPDDS